MEIHSEEKVEMLNGGRAVTLTNSHNGKSMQGVGEVFDKVQNNDDVIVVNEGKGENHDRPKTPSKHSVTQGVKNKSELSQRHGEKVSHVKNKDDVKIEKENIPTKSPPVRLLSNEMLRHVVTIPIQKMEEGDDLGIYDDPGESGEDLDDVDGPDKSDTILQETGVEKAKIPPPILRNSAVRNPSDAPRQENMRYSENSVNFREGLTAFDENANRVSWSAINNHYDEARHLSGIRGKANTPASFITDISSESRNTSRVPSESREAMYRRAMHLITARCTSTAPGMETPYGTARTSPFGVQVPQYFYIRQERPTPMPPLKAWQGYNGNVYFEPIQISSLRELPEKSNNPYESRSSDLHRMLMSQQQSRPDSDAMRTTSRNTAKTGSSLKSNRPSTTKQVVLLDKKTVLNRYNDSLNDDLDVIEGTEHTGSLSVRPKSDRSFDRKSQNNNKVYNKEKICKGSVVHKLNVANKQHSGRPVLKVSGGKYSSPPNTSPLLRTQTQYSLSNQRLTTNSPDMYSQQLLPPLEQLRSAVRHMDTISKDRVGFGRIRPVTYTEEFKPFIKYSQEAKQQTNFV
ncbi:uncharacterized protein LOC133192704 [Saccostrea echinata]|uniref:uncharacterized protein LOC133192704 n=1 Tax=Saccostrea echinata TaxID=191078 RepID=UPI002A83E89A|nr:uncharacterized protein LOC133192704 [Saccostrea echinata]